MATMKTLNGYGFNATEFNGKTSDSYLQLGDDETGSTGAAPMINAGMFGGMTVSQFVDMIYPVGSIYMSVVSTSPATLFGGTWEQLKDRFLLGAGSTYSAGGTGGEATHKLTINEIPSHNGHLYGNAGRLDGKGNAKGKWLAELKDNSSSTAYGWNYSNNEYYPANQSLGGSGVHNNMPPYLAVYMWKRTA